MIGTIIERLTRFLLTGHWLWVTFTLSALIIVAAAMQLARSGDVIAARTGLGGMFIGVLLLAGATSLPEMLTGINAVLIDSPDIAAGNFFGSSSFNMLILAILDLLSRNRRILREGTYQHVLSGGLGIFICTLVLFFIGANPVLDTMNFKIGWIGIDSIIIAAVYIFSIYLIDQEGKDQVSVDMSAEELAGVPSLRKGVLGFVGASLVLVAVSPLMVAAADKIAVITNLGASFVGSTLVAFVTSLPELVTSIAALSIGAPEMAMGNLFGSNMFNMLAISITDIFYVKGRLMSAINPAFMVTGMLGIMMMALAVVGNVAHFKRFKILEFDSIVMITLYFGGMYILYMSGAG